MIINHLTLSVTNVKETTNFFIRYFGFECLEEKGDGAIAILTNKTEFILVLIRVKETAAYPKDFHIGFLQKTDDDVKAVYNSLLTGGIKLESEPQPIRGKLGFYFYIPDGNIMLEVSRL
jgi:catechol-2,3-dioxygenase